jgi:hypothetical protein
MWAPITGELTGNSNRQLNVDDELGTLLQILETSYRLSPNQIEQIQSASPNPILLAVVEQFRMDHDYDEAAETLRYYFPVMALRLGLLVKVVPWQGKRSTSINGFWLRKPCF